MNDAIEEEVEEQEEEECPKCPPVGAPAWMATFADMATLLMAFFVLILSFAEFNVEIQADFWLAEEALVCSASSRSSNSRRHNSPVAEFQPLPLAVCHPGHDAADKRHHQTRS